MKKTLAIFILSSLSLYADGFTRHKPGVSRPLLVFNEKLESEKSSSFSNRSPTIEFKGGYFFFSNSQLRDIYNKGGYDFQLSGTYPLYKWLDLYASIEYLRRHGYSQNGNQATAIWQIPLSLGLRAIATLHERVEYYFTLGPRYFFVHTHQDSCYVDSSLSANGLGGFANTGFNFLLCHGFFLDLFGEYSYKKMRFHPSRPNVSARDIQIGGYTFGLGAGYKF